MAISDKPWGAITAADYADAGDYCDACLINMNDGQREGWIKDKCKLPVREPAKMGGAINRNGAHACAAVLAGARGGVQAPSADKRKAARKLATMYHGMNEQLPDSVRRMAQ